MNIEASPTQATAPRRRLGLLAGGIALASMAAGGGVAWWLKSQRTSPDLPVSGAQNLDIWALQLAGVAGAPLSLSEFRGKPLLINFWATWCPPCVEELPLLNRFFAENHANGWQVLGIAVDRVDSVQSFLKRNSLKFPVAVDGAGGLALSRALGNPAGSLPFSVVYAPSGDVVYRKIGQLAAEDLGTLRRNLTP